MTKIVNLFGGPGTGKSTMCAGIFAELKHRGVNTEMALEYTKRKVWEKSTHVLDDQIYIFGKQYHTVNMLVGEVDVIVTDSPLLLSLVYSRNQLYYDELEKLVLKIYSNMDNINIFLTRKKKYNPFGRMQTKSEAVELDDVIMSMLDTHGIHYVTITADSNIEDVVDEYIMETM